MYTGNIATNQRVRTAFINRMNTMKAIKYITALSLLTFMLASCGSDNFENTVEIESPIEPIVIEYDNPLAFSTARGAEYLQEGIAYETKNSSTGRSLFTIASEAVEVECPGSAASYDGGGVFFLFQFIPLDDEILTFSGNLTAEIDGKKRAAFYSVPPTCTAEPIETEYTIEDGRIIGTITGEYYYIAEELVEPFESCENFISTGELIVNFDLPLTVCN